MTRHDISNAVNLVSQIIHTPHISHLYVAQRIFWYL